jgi:hypothetical protein
VKLPFHAEGLIFPSFSSLSHRLTASQARERERERESSLLLLFEFLVSFFSLKLQFWDMANGDDVIRSGAERAVE